MTRRRTYERHQFKEREGAVVVLDVQGLNSMQIAGKLVEGPSAIKSHISNILTALGDTSRDEALALAL